MQTRIHNVRIFCNDSQNRILRDHVVVIDGGRIKSILPEKESLDTPKPLQEIDGRGRLLMPGLVNTHMHFYGTFARGISMPETPSNFHEILKMLWWRLDSSLDLDAVYYSALIPAITAVKRGVTSIIDHHASPNALDGSLDRIEDALQATGLRGILCYEVSDRDGKQIARQGLAENQRYTKRCADALRSNPDHPYQAMIGLHASFTLDDDTLAAAGDLCRNTGRGCHVHVWEDGVDGKLTRERYHSGIAERLLKNGLLDNDSIAAHGIYLEPDERQIFADQNTIVVHNPQSNMNNAVGRADIFDLLQRGILVGLGTDGMSPDIWPDARTANLLHKHDLRSASAGWNEIQQMLLKNNPAIYQRISGLPVGVIAPGSMADVILLDYYPPTPMTAENIWGHFLFGIADAPVSMTMIGGKVVMENGQLPGIDEQSVAEKSRAVARQVWQRFAGTG